MVNPFGPRRNARIGGVDPCDIGPDVHACGVKRLTEKRRRVITTTASQRSGMPCGIPADKPLGHHNRLLKTRAQVSLHQVVQGTEFGFGAAETRVGTHHAAGVKPPGLGMPFT